MSELGSGSGTSYPGALDTDTTLEVNSPNAGKTKARAEVANDSGAAIVAIQTEMGTDPAGTTTDVKSFLQADHNTDGTHSSLAGHNVQQVHTQTGAVNTGTTVLPSDDTIPQITEGDEYMTLAITPTSATNKLIIEVVFFGARSGAELLTAALFQDATANALAVSAADIKNANMLTLVAFNHEMVAGTTSSTTFRVRAGGASAGTNTFNGSSGARLYGGVLASSLRITEVVV